MDTTTLTDHFNAFIAEATRLADSFSDVGEDDNSYDASGLATEAKEVLQQVADDEETPTGAIAWLAEARTRLNDIS